MRDQHLSLVCSTIDTIPHECSAAIISMISDALYPLLESTETRWRTAWCNTCIIFSAGCVYVRTRIMSGTALLCCNVKFAVILVQCSAVASYPPRPCAYFFDIA